MQWRWWVLLGLALSLGACSKDRNSSNNYPYSQTDHNYNQNSQVYPLVIVRQGSDGRVYYATLDSRISANELEQRLQNQNGYQGLQWQPVSNNHLIDHNQGYSTQPASGQMYFVERPDRFQPGWTTPDWEMNNSYTGFTGGNYQYAYACSGWGGRRWGYHGYRNYCHNSSWYHYYPRHRHYSHWAYQPTFYYNHWNLGYYYYRPYWQRPLYYAGWTFYAYWAWWL